jgi:para-aminobenzoate synthetase/4-amino-4-deoxychorismate lyase
MSNRVVLQDAQGSRWLAFSDPVQIVSASRSGEIGEKLAQVEAAINGDGLFAAGFISYEASPAFDSALKVRQASNLPLLWFGLYERAVEIDEPDWRSGYSLGQWRPSIERDAYNRAFAKIKEHIASGHTYQVNYTFRLRTRFEGDPWALFGELALAQQAQYAAFVDTDAFAICSASPELFFQLDGAALVSKPMKGTVGRGRTLAEDNEFAEWLRHSQKNRAENVMIVDMIRNDMGKVSSIGSVRVPRLFEVECYPTIWQMTSTVTSHTHASPAEIMMSLFPCASITGAPKVRTMQIIAALETAPRGIYTGCIGYIAPGRRAQCNVAIRTVLVDKCAGRAEYGVGGGIVWDSDPDDEYLECQTKAGILTKRWPEFELLESLLWTPSDGYFLLEHHLRRLADSAAYFRFALDLAGLREKLAAYESSLPPEQQKVRLLLSREGEVLLQASGIGSQGSVRLGLATRPVNSGSIFLFHKTTHRNIYESLRAGRPDCEEVLLWNEHGQITEGTTANVVAKIGGEMITPPVECGLLGGTFRRHLLDRGIVHEEIITREDLRESQAVYLVNSVRKWREAILVDEI